MRNRRSAHHVLLLLVLLLGLALPGRAQVLEVSPDEGFPLPDFCVQYQSTGFVVQTARLVVYFKEGAIVGITALPTGEIHADPNLLQLNIPRGMVMRGDGNTANLAALGSLLTNTKSPVAQEAAPWFHHPLPGSSVQVHSDTSSCTATWNGLTDGSHTYPDESLQLDVTTGDDGELMYRATVHGPTPGAFGVSVPIVNLHSDHKLYVPALGGTMYDTNPLPFAPGGSWWVPFDRSPAFEAPVLAIESSKTAASGSLGLWIADSSLPANMLFLSWNQSTFGASIMPYDLTDLGTLLAFQGPWLHLDFAAGGWVAAMERYKTWYATNFASQLSKRSANTAAWGSKIRAVVDQWDRSSDGVPDSSVISYLHSRFDPDKVLFHDWEARDDPFDSNLPRHHPKPGSVVVNDTLRSAGFRSMSWVSAHYVNYGSPGFVGCHVEQFASGSERRYHYLWDLAHPLPDFSGATCYPGSAACVSGNSCAPLDCTRGQFFALNPSSQNWRHFHVDEMVTWSRNNPANPRPFGTPPCSGTSASTYAGFDANYEDTAGFAGDSGRGLVDGTKTPAGEAVLMDDLLTQVGVPMATEYASDTTGFGTSWTLQYQSARYQPLDPTTHTAQEIATWELLRRWILTHQRPVSSYLFGNFAWVPTVRVKNNFMTHLVAHSADALGGLGMLRAERWNYAASRGDLGHLSNRAEFFADNDLLPYFETARDAGLTSMYRNPSTGAIYEYRADANAQTMKLRGGADVYSRINGLRQITTTLRPKGWPAYTSGAGAQVFGLEPASRYVFESGVPDTNIQVTSLSPINDVRVSKYYEASSYSVLVLERNSLANSSVTTASLTVKRTVPIIKIIRNGTYSDFPGGDTVSFTNVPLPAYFVFVRDSSYGTFALNEFFHYPGESGRFIEKETGIDRGGDLQAQVPSSSQLIPGGGSTSFFLPWASENTPHTFDYYVNVPIGTAYLQIYYCHGNGDSSEGVVSVNGREVGRMCGGSACSSDPNSATLFQYAIGSELVNRGVVVSIAYDNGSDNNSDGDARWFSRPRFVTASPAPCPSVTACGGAGCLMGDPEEEVCNSTDTHGTTCVSDGEVLNCPCGQTIRIDTCPCYPSSPLTFCALTHQSWHCE